MHLESFEEPEITVKNGDSYMEAANINTENIEQFTYQAVKKGASAPGGDPMSLFFNNTILDQLVDTGLCGGNTKMYLPGKVITVTFALQKETDDHFLFGVKLLDFNPIQSTWGGILKKF
jgi:hypothetical protein